MDKKFKAGHFFLIALLLIFFLEGCERRDLLAKVGKIEIKKADVEAIVNRLKAEKQGFFEKKGFEEEVRRKVFDGLIIGALIESNQDYLGVKVTQEEIDREVNKYKRFYGKRFKKALKNFGFTEESFRYMVFRSLLFRKALKLVEKEVQPVTEKKAKEYYRKNQEKFQVGEVYRLFLAKIASKKEAQKITQKIKKKEDVYQIASQFDLSPFPGFSDFDTGWKKKSELSLEVYEKVAKLKPGEAAVPFKVNKEGWALVKLIEKKEKRIRPFSEVKNHINSLLYEKHKEQAWKKLIKRLKKRTKVKIYQEI